jgi:uncharacterized protein with NRDE domain
MCLIAFAWRCHPRYSLALIANRDEFHGRPSAPAGFHADAPDVYGGRDLEKGGGWLQVSTHGRLAAVTNVRVGRTPEAASRSRGELVHRCVRETGAALPAWLPEAAGEFGRFNLLVWNGDELKFAGNHPGFHTQMVEPGLHRLSNAVLDDDWPKARRAENALRDWLGGDDAMAASPALTSLFAVLAEREQADDADLPDTGVGIELERMLSSPFIVGERYGTRSSTIVLVDADGIVFCERSFGPNGRFLGEIRQHLPRAC